MVSFSAQFIDHCEGASPALRGDLSYNTNTPPPPLSGSPPGSGALRPSSNHLEFGEATLGTYVGPMQVTLTNITTSSDQVTGYRFAGDNDFLFDNAHDQCSSVLAPGASCVLEFDFLPGSLGTRTLTLAVLDTENSGVTITMTGIGGIGYYQVSAAGAIAHFGDAGYFGDASSVRLNHPIVGIAQTGDNGGYWLVASDGGILTYGDAGFFGSTGSLTLNKPIIGMAPTIDAGGYWLVASDGGIFSFGDAQFYGSTGSIRLNKPIVGVATTPDGGGYWLVASDGGIFSFGDASFFGSTGSLHLNKPIVGMAATPDGGGYWLVASDGGIFSFGDAPFYGSTGSIHLNQPVVAMTAMPDGNGYWFTAADGGLFNYGSAPFQGAATGQIGNVVAMTTDGAPTLQAALDQPALRHEMPPLSLALLHGRLRTGA